MNFLSIVKKLYPSKFIRTRQLDKIKLYNGNDINDLLGTSIEFEEDDQVTLYNHCTNYPEEEYYITEFKVDELLNTVKNDVTKNILNELHKVLTRDVLKQQVLNLFDEVFMFDVPITNYYTVDMYMMKYKIAIELPGSNIDSSLRDKLCKHTGVICVQLHDETTFNGDIVEANKDFCHAMSIVIKNML